MPVHEPPSDGDTSRLGTALIAGASPEGPAVQDGDTGGSWWMPLVLVALLVWLTLSMGVLPLFVVLGFIFVIFMHELGHYLTAKAAGMKVTQFFIGIGPTLFSKQRGEVEYGIKAFPLGAFVRIIGMNNLDPVPEEDEHRAYRQGSYLRRMSVVLAGSAMHFMMAFVALLLLHSVIGWQGPSEADPAVERWDIEEVMEGSAAEGIGLQAGDRIQSIGGFELSSFNDLAGFVVDSANQPIDMVVMRGGETLSLAGVIGERTIETGEVVGSLGVVKGTFTPSTKGPVESFTRSIQDFGTVAKESVVGVIGLPGFLAERVGLIDPAPAVPAEGAGAGTGSDDGSGVMGVVGIVRVGALIPWSLLGILFVSSNISIGVFNLVPLLPFDGGHAAIATYERIREAISKKRHHADVAKLMPLTYATLAVLLLMFAVVTWDDLFNFPI